MNVAVLIGSLSSPPELRTLASGTVLAQLQVTTRVDGEPTRSVPVALADPPAWVEDLDAGDEIVVLGAVHRRYFRAQGVPGGATASRVEVVAERIGRARDRRARARVAKQLWSKTTGIEG